MLEIIIMQLMWPEDPKIIATDNGDILCLIA